LPAVQDHKVQALGLKNVMDKIIYTWDYGPEKEKPHPYSFSLMLQCLDTDPNSVLFIGDNPEKDCKGAHGVGMKCAQVMHAKKMADLSVDKFAERPEFIIETLYQLPHILEHMN